MCRNISKIMKIMAEINIMITEIEDSILKLVSTIESSM